jgi:hypothetical protein
VYGTFTSHLCVCKFVFSNPSSDRQGASGVLPEM